MPDSTTPDALDTLIDLLKGLRSGSALALDAFVRAAASGDGGELSIKAPCSWAKRPRFELSYRSEGWEVPLIMRIPRQA
jgi:hypothetical protein